MEEYDISIMRAIKYIENDIHGEITLDQIADEAAFSKFHFTRVFKAVTKESINQYIRKRRLTLAAKDLIETEMPINQLALDYGYTTQEAFTRSFKSFTGLSPHSYRKKGSHFHNLYKAELNESALKRTKQHADYPAQIVKMSTFFIAGLECKEIVDNHQISKLWNRFYDELQEASIDPNTVPCYGYESLDDADVPFYIAAIKVDSLERLPEGWIGVKIPGYKYVSFTLYNDIEQLPYAIEYIYKIQLPAMNLKPDLNFNLEFYDVDYAANDPAYTLKILIPIK